jgi:hypothetical protein
MFGCWLKSNLGGGGGGDDSGGGGGVIRIHDK